MKKYLFSLFFALFALSSISYAQTPKSEKEVKSLLCHKWILVKMVSDGETMIPGEEERMYLTFNADGTFIDEFDGEQSPGKWSYNHATMSITIRGISKKIVKVNEQELILSDKTAKVTMKRVAN